VLNRHATGASFIALGLGTVGGCSEPVDPGPKDVGALFRSDVRAADSLGDGAWREFLRAPALHRAWAPDPNSPWRPYYRPTLPAAVSVVASAAQPIHRGDSAATSRADELVRKLDLTQAAIFIDLAGEESVAWGARLAEGAFQPVATFNNWPHARGILKLERALGAMIFYAAEVQRRPADKFKARPAFLLEGTRLQSQRMPLGPDEFDNRYFHVGSDFPSATRFAAEGINTVIYVRPSGMTKMCEDDLVDYFVDLQTSGMKFHQVTVEPGSLSIVPWIPAARETIFTRDLTHTYVSQSRWYGRSYSHYHSFWYGNRSTWGSPSSGGGGSSGGRYS